MTASLNPYISTFDADFDAEKSSQYRMTIQFSLGGFSYALLDTSIHTLIGLECYQSDYLLDSDEMFRTLEKALEAKNLNTKDFESITCLVDSRTNTLVPTNLYDEKEAHTYLDFTAQLNKDQVVLSDLIESVPCVNVFAFPKAFMSKIRSKWPTAKIRHTSSVFVESSFRYAPEGKVAFVNVRSRDFDLAIIKDGRLSFFNNFRFNTKDDFAYFLLLSIEENGESGLELPVCFSGFIQPASEIISLCSRYVRYLVFVEDRHELRISQALDKEPFQYYHIHYQALR